MDNTPRGRIGEHAKGNRPNNPDMLWIDAIAQQGLAAFCIAALAELIGEHALAAEWNARYEAIRETVNRNYWDEKDGCYYDIGSKRGEFMKILTPASFWPLVSGMGTPAQAEALRNAAESGREEEAAALLERLEDAAEQYEGGLSHTHLSEDIVDLDIPVSLADLEQDAQHRTVTDAEKQSWNAATSGSSENLLSQLLSCVYPVGSIYLSVNETSPAIFLGGQWERISDRFLLASGSSYAAGSTGGSALHNHDYKLSFANYNLGFDTSADGLGVYNYDSKSYVKARVAGGVNAKGLYNVSVETHTLSVSYLDGGNTSYKENLPPYLAVYAWKRVA